MVAVWTHIGGWCGNVATLAAAEAKRVEEVGLGEKRTVENWAKAKVLRAASLLERDANARTINRKQQEREAKCLRLMLVTMEPAETDDVIGGCGRGNLARPLGQRNTE